MLDTYPNDAPISYICPTSDMYINVSTNVDLNGRISLSYLKYWKSNQSPNILGLIQSCVNSFYNNPPVLLKPQDLGTNTQQPQPKVVISKCPTVLVSLFCYYYCLFPGLNGAIPSRKCSIKASAMY